MTTNLGQILTRADIPGLVEVAKGIAGGSGAVSGGGGGIGDLEGVLRFIERVVPLFEQAGTMYIKLLKEDAVEQPDQVVMSDPQMAAAPPRPPAAAAPKISPMKVYAAALGALVDLQKMDPEMSIAAALTMARDYKDMLLPMIEEKLPDLLEDPSDA
ncbi:MAG TPA: hypothetical protein EYN66_19055 [Myxococcales bacterium]|nr:hypothetical protein [Myxococcales bacterium]